MQVNGGEGENTSAVEKYKLAENFLVVYHNISLFILFYRLTFDFGDNSSDDDSQSCVADQRLGIICDELDERFGGVL